MVVNPTSPLFLAWTKKKKKNLALFWFVFQQRDSRRLLVSMGVRHAAHEKATLSFDQVFNPH